MKKCPPTCPCLCHEFGITAEHGQLDRCPTKLGRPLVDPQWVSQPMGKAARE